MTEWKKARKKPIVVKFREMVPNFPSCLLQNTDAFLRNLFTYRNESSLDCERVVTKNGVVLALTDDFIIRGVEGEVYPIKKDIFYKTYEVVE
jgi:hypothetical protein